MTTFIAAGSNLNDRQKNLLSAVKALIQAGYHVTGVSPVYETPAALLYDTAKDDWNKPYLNCLIRLETKKSAFELLADLKKIEKNAGRNADERWAPRPIELDIIEHNDEHIDTPELCVPHKQYLKRSFVLDPLSCFKAVPPEFLYTETHQPLIMGILNITPDSFSDGGQNNQPGVFEKKAALWADHLIPLIDVGAESTRPGARPLDPAEEIQRLATVFDFVKNREKTPFSPRFSIDTYHFETARKALENGFDLLNDIHGLDDPEMLSLAKAHKDKPCIFMHNRDLTGLPLKNTVEVVEQWLEEKINLFEQNGLCPYNMIFDPGVGFGKTACQSLQILQNLSKFHRFGVRLLIGHSRKSFMKIFTDKPPIQKDTETLGISIKIAEKTDILRVHTPLEHKEALLAAAHLENQFF